jgi:hypothetical protein
MSQKSWFLLMSLAVITTVVGPAHAQAQEPPRSKDTALYWDVVYWNNTSLSGDPVATGTNVNLDHDWGAGSPHANVNADQFSVRWTRTAHFEDGAYRFTATADDGVRVFVDGRPIIDQWHDHPARTYTGDVSLTAGHHLVVVEYYENTGLAVAKVSWGPIPVASQDWHAKYFANRWLSRSPVLVRDEAGIDHSWGYGSPAAGIPSDGFSVRWTRVVDFEPGLYRFTTTSDDGVRLWVDGRLLVDQWRDQPFRSHSDTMYVAGDVPIKLEYYENRGVAAVRLTWAREDDEPLPTGAERIRFAPGATQTTVEGYLPTNGKVYVMRVAAGQFIEMDATARAMGQGLRFSIVGADGVVVKAMGNAHIRTVVPSTQDYYVELISDVGAVDYRMSVLIPARIRFAPGATSAKVAGSLTASGMRHYVLRAVACQRMIVDPRATRGQVGLVISGAGGQVLLSGRVGRPGGVYDGILPTTQDYLITVRAEGGTGADYTLEITIPPL